MAIKTFVAANLMLLATCKLSEGLLPMDRHHRHPSKGNIRTKMRRWNILRHIRGIFEAYFEAVLQAAGKGRETMARKCDEVDCQGRRLRRTSAGDSRGKLEGLGAVQQLRRGGAAGKS
ncbi:hypothetical protein Nepgr_024290 [Nepenthes gracilis]|uniref:Secreted protein n=1 Tax=Nepenthes gracilis TaxID=150966 RepID=A0AAD3T4C9_NEPGR|nr:hypothetical protein Nepgr_024290 [Nepenthes gracilis]